MEDICIVRPISTTKHLHQKYNTEQHLAKKERKTKQSKKKINTQNKNSTIIITGGPIKLNSRAYQTNEIEDKHQDSKGRKRIGEKE